MIRLQPRLIARHHHCPIDVHSVCRRNTAHDRRRHPFVSLAVQQHHGPPRLQCLNVTSLPHHDDHRRQPCLACHTHCPMQQRFTSQHYVLFRPPQSRGV